MQTMPAGSWEIQILYRASSGVTMRLELGHPSEISDYVTTTTAVVPVTTDITYITISYNIPGGVINEAGAVVMRYLGALTPSPKVVACAPTQTALVISNCNSGSPWTCDPDAFNVCVNSPNYDSTNKAVSFSTMFWFAPWSLPPKYFYSGFYATIYQYPMTQVSK
jgi:hypothetical protein